MVPSSLTPSLETAANAQINAVLSTGARAVGQKAPTGEVGFVAAFVLGAVPEIAKAWKPLLRPHGLSVKMSGVFCHQSPMVSFTDKSGAPLTCELADLLVVVEDLTSGSPTSRYAVLVQAKMASGIGGQTLTKKRDLTQLYLLSNWPSFALTAGFAPGARDFATCMHVGSAFDCGRYGLINRHASPKWHQHAPARSMPAGGDELGIFLARMLEGRLGYGREATGTSDDWSRTVDELMKVTFGLAFTYSAGLKGQHPRGNTGLALVVTHDADPFKFGLWASAPPPDGGRPDLPAEEFPSEGINLVYIGITTHEPRG